MIDDGYTVSDPWNDTYNTSTGTVKAYWAEYRWALRFSIHALWAEETRRANHYSEHGLLTGGLIAAVVTWQTWQTLLWSLILRKKSKTENQNRRWINETVYLFVTVRQHALDYNELSGLQNNFLFHRLLGWLWPDEDRSSRQDTQNNLLLCVPLLTDEMLPWTHRKNQIHWSLTQIYFSQWDCYSRWTGSGFGCTLFTVIAFWTDLTVLFSTITHLCAVGAWRAWVLWAI